jgi:hypothetical protein
MPKAAYIIQYDRRERACAGFLTSSSPSSRDPHILAKDILIRDITKNVGHKGTGSRE